MGDVLSSSEEETQQPPSPNEKKGFVISKSDSGEVRITHGFLYQLRDDQLSEDEYYVRERELEQRVHQLMAAAKLEGMQEVMRDSQQKFDSLNSALEEEREKNKNLKNATYPILEESALAVENKINSDTFALTLNKHNIICYDEAQKIFQCYHDNPDRSLYCAEEMKNYINCTKSARSKLSYKSNSRDIT